MNNLLLDVLHTAHSWIDLHLGVLHVSVGDFIRLIQGQKAEGLDGTGHQVVHQLGRATLKAAQLVSQGHRQLTAGNLFKGIAGLEVFRHTATLVEKVVQHLANDVREAAKLDLVHEAGELVGQVLNTVWGEDAVVLVGLMDVFVLTVIRLGISLGLTRFGHYCPR